MAKPLASEVAAQIIEDLSAWQVYSPKAEDILDAIQLQNLYHLGFWDAMIVSSAISLGCEILWSEDLNSGQVYDSVKVLNPFSVNPE